MRRPPPLQIFDASVAGYGIALYVLLFFIRGFVVLLSAPVLRSTVRRE